MRLNRQRSDAGSTQLNKKRSDANKGGIIRHIMIGLLSAVLLIGGPIYAVYGPLGTGSADAVSSATVVIEQPSGAYVVLINRDRHANADNLDTWVTFFGGGDFNIIFEDISCIVPNADAGGLELAKSFQSRLPENQMKLRTEDTTLLLSKAAYGEFDVIIFSREAYDAYGAKTIAVQPFVECVESDGIEAADTAVEDTGK